MKNEKNATYLNRADTFGEIIQVELFNLMPGVLTTMAFEDSKLMGLWLRPAQFWENFHQFEGPMNLI